MPGVQVTTLPRAGAGAPLIAPSGTWFVAGVTERGDTVNPVELRGIADFSRKLGDPVSYGTLYDQAVTFFQEGGARMYVARLVGATPVVGTRTISDTNVAPAPTLRADAASPGGWSSRVTTQVRAGNDPNTFRWTVFLDGVQVEDYNNLATPAAAAAATANSVYVRLTDLGSASVAPANNPAVDNAPVAFTTQGNDDRASITDAMRVTALGRFPASLGDGAVSIPGAWTNTIYAGVIAHCQANNRVALLSAARGTAAATLETTAEGYGATSGSEGAALVAPWVLVPDGKGGSVAQGPLGYAAAVRNRAHEQEGPWRIPAGDIAQARYVIGVDAPFDDATADALDAARVSVIRQIGSDVQMYGWRSLSSDEADYYWLKNRDLLNYIAFRAKSLLRSEVFKNVDSRGQMYARIRNRLIGFMEPIRASNGVYEGQDASGNTVDPGYSVDVGPDVNTPATLQQQQVNAVLMVRPAPGASLIKLAITEVSLTSPV